ncbi:SOS response-associated peptidase [Rhizobium sp. GCM10022189]|uniref:SOS response-associated peptidase n=1 Tax=Rhizobium sp. GCM10022189 TaxID=3252654 RepID=UPI000DDD0763
MCGRVFVKSDFETLLRNFSFARRADSLNLGNQFPRYNGAPSLDYPVIVKEEDRAGKVGPVFVSARWGLIPGWAKPPFRPMVNARADTLSSKATFRAAYRSRRCLVPIDGYFEWKGLDPAGKNKLPYAIAMKSREPFALAGIWEMWRNPETDERIRTFAIVTCEANAMMAEIHDRMPVILHRKDYDRWLSDEPDPADLMVPYPSEEMVMWPVRPGKSGVGSYKNNSPDILDEVDPDAEPSLI